MLAEKETLQIVNPLYRPVNQVLLPNCAYVPPTGSLLDLAKHIPLTIV